MGGNQSFSKGERLHGKDAIEEVFQQGKAIHMHPFKVLFLPKDEGQKEFSRLTIVVGKRNFRHASDRNLLKRRIREAYRTNKSIFLDSLKKTNSKCTWILIYVSHSILPYNEIREKIILTLQRLTNEYEKVNK